MFEADKDGEDRHMTPDLINKATRNEFREVLVGFVLRDIDMIFEGAGLTPRADHSPSVGGQRRSLVEQYYANIDFGSATDIQKILAAYEEILLRLERSSETWPETRQTIKDLLRRMERDGYRYEKGRFVVLPHRQPPLVKAIRDHAAVFDLDGINRQVERLAAAAESDPALAVGTAKELVETVCKTILEDRGITPGNDDFPKLVRAVAKELSLLPDGVSEKAKGSDVIRRLLSNLGQVTQGLAELRNLYGTGHGRSARAKGVQPRHAKLAIGSAATLAVFLLETHLERKADASSSPASVEVAAA